MKIPPQARSGRALRARTTLALSFFGLAALALGSGVAGCRSETVQAAPASVTQRKQTQVQITETESQTQAPRSEGGPGEAQGGTYGGMPGGMQEQPATMCPMQVLGAQVTVNDTSNGVALTFTTTDSERVSDLRERAVAMAEMHNACMQGTSACPHMGGQGSQPSAQPGTPSSTPPGAGAYHGGQGRGMVPSTATVEEVDGGARLLMTPINADDADTLRARVRRMASRMSQDNRCPMLQGAHGTGAAPETPAQPEPRQ